jgi:hypothetical protein
MSLSKAGIVDRGHGAFYREPADRMNEATVAGALI